MSNVTKLINAAQLESGYLKFYMSHTTFFLAGGYKLEVPVEGFRPFIFTDIQFIKQGQADTGIEDQYEDAILINSGDAVAYKGMSAKNISSIQSRMNKK